MKALVITAIAALTLALAAAPTTAKCYGCGANGKLLNGIWSNGIWENGTSYQGSSMQGSQLQGSRTHGAEVTIGSADLVKIELPR
jgi:hypothetical protein